jgi:hypothetical protein
LTAFKFKLRRYIKGDDDTSNFDDYSATADLKHDFELTSDEQDMFADM